MVTKTLSWVIFLAMPMLANAAEYRIVERPRQQCWNEQVAVRSSGSGYGGAVIGGIAGGLLGNRIGKGNGRAVATAIGAATGAVAGDRIGDRYPASPSYQTVERCKTVVDHVRVPVFYETEPVYGPVAVYHYREYYVADQPKWRRHSKHHRDDDDDDDDDDEDHGRGRHHDDD
ncbi:glycine zipper 2TM domain-containing protein [Duganella hordei]|uniref:glycine zipper 2TM domain-containing protein n=1 Tax=Duganella hordei TaxID=2865934 RepID=UPI0030E8B92E